MVRVRKTPQLWSCSKLWSWFDVPSNPPTRNSCGGTPAFGREVALGGDSPISSASIKSLQSLPRYGILVLLFIMKAYTLAPFFSVLFPPAAAGVIPFCPRLFYLYPYPLPAARLLSRAALAQSSDGSGRWYKTFKLIYRPSRRSGSTQFYLLLIPKFSFNGAALLLRNYIPGLAGAGSRQSSFYIICGHNFTILINLIYCCHERL